MNCFHLQNYKTLSLNQVHIEESPTFCTQSRQKNTQIMVGNSEIYCVLQHHVIFTLLNIIFGFSNPLMKSSVVHLLVSLLILFTILYKSSGILALDLSLNLKYINL